jgi:hypothetical protein
MRSTYIICMLYLYIIYIVSAREIHCRWGSVSIYNFYIGVAFVGGSDIFKRIGRRLVIPLVVKVSYEKQHKS